MRKHKYYTCGVVQAFVICLIFTACAGLKSTAGGSTSGTTSPGPTITTSSGSNRQGSLTVAGVVRSYILHTPPGFPGSQSWSLVLDLHGGGGDATAQAHLSNMSAVADEHGFVVVYPNGLNKHWNDGRGIANNNANDLGFLSNLITTLVANDHIDRTRIYVTGMSNGAMMAQYVGCQLSAQVAAIAPVEGLMPTPDATNCHPTHPMPIAEFQGTSDPLMPDAGGPVKCDPNLSNCGTVLSTTQTMALWARLNGCGTTFTTSQLPDLNKADGPPPGNDSTVQKLTFRGCPANGAVVLYQITGGGHTWAGGPQYAPKIIIGSTNRDINASEVIWQFFATQRLS